jgi:hypothetical protein
MIKMLVFNNSLKGGGMKRILAAAVLIAVFASTIMAADFQTIGTMGMGGAGVARDMGAYAPYWNPAGLAFASKAFSSTIGVGVGARVSDGLANNVDRLSKFTEGNPSTFDNLTNLNTTVINPTVVGDIVNLLSVVKDIEAQKGTISANGDIAVGFQLSRFGTGVFMLSEGYGKIATIDLLNVLPESNASAAVRPNDLITLAGTGNATQTFFSSAQVIQLRSSLSGLGITGTAQSEVINAFGNSLSTLKNPSLPGLTPAQAVETFTSTVAPALASAVSNPAQNINNNKTAVMVKNALFTEIPISYGHALDIGEAGKVGIGATLKVVNGRVYQTRINLIENGENVTSEDVFEGLKDNYEQSTNVTFDVGAQWKYSDWVSLGIVAKNLTSPAFKSPELKDQKGRLVRPDGSLTLAPYHEADVKLKPQARLGFALTPANWITFAGDVDLTENETVLSGVDYKNRHFGGGFELSPLTWAKIRCGMYKNLSNSAVGPVATAGLTFGAPWITFEIDGAYSFETTRYNDQHYPKESRVQAQLAMQF